MARSYPNGFVSSVVSGGIGWQLPDARAWPRAAWQRLRTSVMPELDPDPTEPRIEPPAASSASHPHRRVPSLLLRRFIPAILLIVLLLVTALVAFRVVYADRVFPAVVVGDVPVGGLTVTEAQARLTDRADDLERGTVSFSWQGETWMPSLAELGVTVELDDSLAAARQLGRGDNPTSRLAFIGEILDADQMIPLRTQVDEQALNAWFDSVDQDMDRLPVNARIAVEGTEFAIVPDETGIVVDRKAATAYLLDALTTLQPVAVELPTRVAQPKLTADDLASVRGDIEEMIGKPVVATFDGQEWTIAPETVIPFVDVEVVLESGVPTSHLTVDTKGLASALRESYSQEVSRKPENAQLGWDDGLVVVEPSVTGAALRSDAFARAVSDSFLNGHAPVEIPVVTVDPKIDDTRLDSYGITTQLGGGHSNFEGGTWERDENVRVATELLDGTLVPPGGTFSFNGAIGEITADKGYQDALVVNGESVGRDIGGGVCQVSTTVFRAALNGGMPIVEWYPHTFRLPNYERDGWGPGFDASILQVGPSPDEWADFKFENYTENWLLVEAFVSGFQVHVNIYGSGDGRSVQIGAWENGGNAFAFNRIVYDAQGGVIADRIFESDYR